MTTKKPIKKASPSKSDTLSDDEAAALWFMLRGAIACTGVSGQRIAEEAEVGWPSLRQYASSARTPSRETFERIEAALRNNGVMLDLKGRKIHVHRSPKHEPQKDPRPKTKK